MWELWFENRGNGVAARSCSEGSGWEARHKSCKVGVAAWKSQSGSCRVEVAVLLSRCGSSFCTPRQQPPSTLHLILFFCFSAFFAKDSAFQNFTEIDPFFSAYLHQPIEKQICSCNYECTLTYTDIRIYKYGFMLLLLS